MVTTRDIGGNDNVGVRRLLAHRLSDRLQISAHKGRITVQQVASGMLAPVAKPSAMKILPPCPEPRQRCSRRIFLGRFGLVTSPFAAGHLRIAISRLAGTLNSTAAFSIASSSLGASTLPTKSVGRLSCGSSMQRFAVLGEPWAL